MSEKEAMQSLTDRYECEIYQGPWGVRCYNKSISVLIHFEEKIQKWGMGTIWEGNKTIWSTGEFAERRKLTTAELINVLDMYLPIKEQTTLF